MNSLEKYKAAEAYALDRLERELPPTLYYHDIRHTRQTLVRTEELAGAHTLSESDTGLLRVAAAFHDIGFLVSRNDHEMHACRIASDVLPEYDFDSDELNAVCSMIMATKVPQEPQDLREEILCDADLDYLGTDEFEAIADRLFREWRVANPKLTSSEFDRMQVGFLTQHKFHTDIQRAARESKKLEWLDKLEKRIKARSAKT